MLRAWLSVSLPLSLSLLSWLHVCACTRAHPCVMMGFLASEPIPSFQRGRLLDFYNDNFNFVHSSESKASFFFPFSFLPLSFSLPPGEVRLIDHKKLFWLIYIVWKYLLQVVKNFKKKRENVNCFFCMFSPA